MKLHAIPISILIVSLVTIGAITYLSDLGDNYGTTADLSGLNNTQDRLDQQIANSQDLSDEITGFQLESVGDFLSIPYKMIKIGWKIAKTMFSSWRTTEAMIVETGEGLSENGMSLPSYVVPTIVAIIIITLAAIVIYTFFKWRMEDK